MKPLTDKEKDILEKLKSGIRCNFRPYMGRFNPNAYWFMSDDYKRCTIQIKGLEKKGYIKIREKDHFGNDREIIILPIPQPQNSEVQR